VVVVAGPGAAVVVEVVDVEEVVVDVGTSAPVLILLRVNGVTPFIIELFKAVAKAFSSFLEGKEIIIGALSLIDIKASVDSLTVSSDIIFWPGLNTVISRVFPDSRICNFICPAGPINLVVVEVVDVEEVEVDVEEVVVDVGAIVVVVVGAIVVVDVMAAIWLNIFYNQLILSYLLYLLNEKGSTLSSRPYGLKPIKPPFKLFLPQPFLILQPYQVETIRPLPLFQTPKYSISKPDPVLLPVLEQHAPQY
jgi:hypothetical protein